MAEISLGTRLKNAWNVFTDNKLLEQFNYQTSSFVYRPERSVFSTFNDRSIISSIYNRMAVDVSSVAIRHVRVDENGRFQEEKETGLNKCLTLEANKDQTGRAFIQDIVYSMFDDGIIAVVPVDTIYNPNITNSYDIMSMRTGKIISWFPDSVTVRLYNDQKGIQEEIHVLKKNIAIIENPLYAIMNEPNSTLKRLVRKLALLDSQDDKLNSNRLDLIIQLPYIVKSEARKLQAEQRKKEVEEQLANSTYGIAYTDGTEKITQLNRPVENNLLKHIEYLTSMLYSQLGLTEDILNGTANEATMLNYYTRTVEPIISAIVDEMNRKFLTKTARTQGQRILYFRDPFKLVPINELAKVADTFTRNEILTSNEIRQIIGIKPSDDPRANQLINSNLYDVKGKQATTENNDEKGDNIQNE